MNKQEYLEARASWKKEYAQLTADIRSAKLARSETARAMSKHGSYDWKLPYSSEYNQTCTKLVTIHVNQANLCKRQRAKATELLDELCALKAEASRAYKRQKENETS